MLHGKIFFILFMLGNCIGFFLPKWRWSPTIMGAISLWFSEMDNSLLHASGHPPENKIEECITFALSYANLYLAESDDERYDKSAATNTFYIFCGSGGSISSLSAIIVSVSATSNVVRCWILTSALFLPNYPLPSDDMVDWDNDSMLGIGGGDTHIY